MELGHKFYITELRIDYDGVGLVHADSVSGAPQIPRVKLLSFAISLTCI